MSEENKTVFEVGDIVEWCGVKGTIKSIDNLEDPTHLVIVKFTNGLFEWFTIEGKIRDWHLEPSLKLIEKAKRKVKKKFWFYIGESDINNLRVSPGTLYINKPKEQNNCQLVELELEVEE